MASQPVAFLTPEQYLEIERAAEFRSEYVRGEMFLMSGGTLNHARIVANAVTELTLQLRGTPCETAANDLRVWSAKSQAYMYPDLVITCGPHKFLDNRRDTITDATAIIEVLSPSTKNYDRGEKFLFYRALDSLSDYLLIAQDRIFAEHHVRQPDGAWLMREYQSAADEVVLHSIDCRLVLGQVYERVEF